MITLRSEWNYIAGLGRSRTLLAFATGLIFVFAFAVHIALAAGNTEEPLRGLSVALTISAALLAATTAFVRSGPSLRALLHPMITPVLYMTYALLVPLAYMAVTGSGIQVMPRTIYNSPTVAVLGLTVLSYCLGVYLASVFIARRRAIVETALNADRTQADRRGGIARDLGRLALALALTAKIQQLVANGPVFSRVYGANQLDYDTGTTIAIASATLTVVGCLLVMYCNSQSVGRPLLWIDWALIGAIGFISLFLLGTRSEIIAPVILYFWFRLHVEKKFSLWIPIAAGGAAVGAFALVALLRTNETFAPQYPIVESVLVDTSSPILLTSNVATLIPGSTGFYLGSTYLEALKFMLPGPIARYVFGEPTGTGAFAYRDLINYTVDGQGWGFSLPTEAYLNFGFIGVVVVAVMVGWLFGSSYRWVNAPGSRFTLRVFVYPLLLSYFPFGLRSDALGQLKSIIYPLLIVWAALIFERFLLARTSGVSDVGPWRWSDLRKRRGER